jgi:hypothetical protein
VLPSAALPSLRHQAASQACTPGEHPCAAPRTLDGLERGLLALLAIVYRFKGGQHDALLVARHAAQLLEHGGLVYELRQRAVGQEVGVQQQHDLNGVGRLGWV